MTDTDGARPPLSPRYWPGWMLVGLIWLLGKLPQWAGLALARPLGWMLYRLLGRRRHIARRNIERCFPELGAAGHESLVREHFEALGRMVFEICFAWNAPRQRFDRMARSEGAENLERARAKGRGILLLTMHSTCLEIGGRIASELVPEIRGVYRPLENPVLEWYQNRCREKYVLPSISKRDLKPVIRHLRGGGVIWYASDQDFGPDRSVFVPFFGIETATLEATLKLIRVSRCVVLPMFPIYDRESRTYVVHYSEPLEDFPGGDDRADLTRINRLFEKMIRRAPEQYWWIHRRFKTRPEGEPPFYD